MTDFNQIVKQFHIHEGHDIHLPMAMRLIHAADRLEASMSKDKETVPVSDVQLRNEQKDVFANVAEYFRDAAIRSAEEMEVAFARIVLPPRTGKTIVAGFIICFAKLHSLFVVPTKVLVQQTADKLRALMPDTPIGMSYDDEKTLVRNGINIVTYAMLQQYQRTHNALPEEIRKAAIIFVDEAHHAMTKKRHKILSDAFDPQAIRIALTATPDYNAQKTLNRFYPELIHEITLFEALEMKLLAPTRFWVAEVDQDASRVSIHAGDYDEGAISKLMSAAPFLEAATKFRYQKANRGKPALITCRTCAQAYELYRYMMAFKPEGTAEPQIVLGETNKIDRERILRQYEIGYYDTLISVGVLIEGWDSPKCKLLIDLAPSISMVRATQKFCRVMTKNGSEEAHIYSTIPANLPRAPLYPIDILGYSVEAYTAGELMDPPTLQAAQQKLEEINANETPEIEHVKLAHRIVASIKVEKPKLNRNDIDAVRRILMAHETFAGNQCWSYFKFRRLVFEHKQFTGTGKQLLNYLGIPNSPACYQLFLEQVLDIQLPEGTNRITYRPIKSSLKTSEQDNEYERMQALFLDPLNLKADPLRGQFGWLALGGKLEPEKTPEEIFADQGEAQWIKQLIPDTLTPMEQKVIYWKMGLYGNPELDLKEIGNKYHVSRERIRQLFEQALGKLRAKIHDTDEQAENTWPKTKGINHYQGYGWLNKTTMPLIERRPDDPIVLDPHTFKPVGFWSTRFKMIVLRTNIQHTPF